MGHSNICINIYITNTDTNKTIQVDETFLHRQAHTVHLHSNHLNNNNNKNKIIIIMIKVIIMKMIIIIIVIIIT